MSLFESSYFVRRYLHHHQGHGHRARPRPKFECQRTIRGASCEACSSCHLLIDPVGLVFENFDEVGRWRDRDNGKPVDSTGEMHVSRDLDGPLADHLELVEGLSTSEQVHRCFNVQVFRFLQGRGERPTDACWLEKRIKSIKNTTRI